MKYNLKIEGAHEPKGAIRANREAKLPEVRTLSSRNTSSESIERQIERQLKEGKKYNALNDIIGKWPGDESFEELIEKLHK